MTSIFPALPAPAHSDWPSSVYEAYDVLRDGFEHNARMLSLDDADPLRLTVLLDKSLGTYKDIIIQLCDQPDLPEAWILQVSQLFAGQIAQLDSAAEAASGKDDANVEHEIHVTVERTGRRGRPTKVINKSYVEKAFEENPNLRKTQLAKELNVHRNTLRKQMKSMGLTSDYSTITDGELDNIVSGYKNSRPLTGYSYLVGTLRGQGLKVSKRRIWSSLRRVDRLAVYLRSKKAGKTARREYHVKRPHALWHLDGHHKLIRWGIVIHGIIDGYSRLIVALRAHTNNEAATVETLFKDAAEEHKTYPSRVRGDRGAENLKVAALMTIMHGLNRGSFIWGSSTHNTRIERLWLEIGRYLGHQWRAFFTRLERLHHLDPQKPHHLWMLHVLFLDTINDDCQNFVRTWNHKPISGEAGNRSPKDMVRVGKTFHGAYRVMDDCVGLGEDAIEQYYGVHGNVRERPEGQEGAGDSDNEDDLRRTSKSKTREVEKRIESNVKHEAVPVPGGRSPFTDEATAARFQSVWDQLHALEFVPSGFGLKAEELDAPYPSFELIRHGKGRGKMLNVPLPHFPWKSRAELWALSIYALDRFCLDNGIEI